MIEPKIKVHIWDIEYHKEKTAVSADLFRCYDPKKLDSKI